MVRSWKLAVVGSIQSEKNAVEPIRTNRAIMRLTSYICVLTIGVFCACAISAKSSFSSDARSRGGQSRLARQTDVLTVFLTGNELGELKPCGCSGGQLGGLDRRYELFRNLPKQKRLIIDTGSLVESDGEQDLIKFRIIIEALKLLDYDLVNLTEKDIEIAGYLGLLDSIGSGFDVISSQKPADVNLPTKFTKQLSLKGKKVAVTVATFDAQSEPIEQLEKLFPSPCGLQTVNILILNRCGDSIIASITKMRIVDCLVCPAESDEMMVIGDPNQRPLVVSVGRYGRHVGRLRIRPGESEDKLNLSFTPIDVNESLTPEESLVELYKSYQQWVKDVNILEKYPRFALPNGLEYTGSKSCRLCHKYEYEKWQARASAEPGGKAHAHAYATLEKVGSQYDPECVICHVVGMEYESGFVSENKTGHLKDVGCENCHGPGSKHIKTPEKVKTTGPQSVCLDCHTPETSGDYAGSELLYMQKIVHWTEPNAPGNVK